MNRTIEQDHFTNAFFDILDEAFRTHHGIFLDRGTSLFETLETINASVASIPVGNKCATLAAQVAHVTFYLEVLEKYLLKIDQGRVDWGEIWRTAGAVTPEEWESCKGELRATYDHVLGLLRGFESWDDEDRIGGALAIVVHTAYHLGEIRQALCTLQ